MNSAKTQVKTKVKAAAPSGSLNLFRLITHDLDLLSSLDDNEERIDVIGVDEVGRGCLAGPVMAAAVRFPFHLDKEVLSTRIGKLNDSKKLSEELRESIGKELISLCNFAVGTASVEEVETHNILNATYLAMERAVYNLVEPEARVILLVDGNRPIKGVKLRQICIVKGDGLSASIAAASVIAKVHRDNFMRELSASYPDFCWHSNKGYSSKDHINALLKLGPTSWHRHSFLKGILHQEQTKQLTTASLV